MDGVKFTDAAGLGQAVRNNKAVPSCLVNRVFSYGVGHKATQSEKSYISDVLLKQFEADGYRLPALLRRIATSDAFFGVAPAPAPESKKASVETTTQTANIQTENAK
jgi:hypothetical protein